MRTRTYSRMMSIALIALAALAAATATAVARRLEISERLILSGFTSFRFEDGAGGFLVNCEVGFEGSFSSRTISKVSGAVIGSITEAIVTRPCPTGSMWTLTTAEGRTNTLPWSFTYISFSGRLPTITRIRVAVIRGGFTVERGGGTTLCLYRPNEAKPLYLDLELAAAGTVTVARVLETEWIPAESPFCPIHGFFRGSGELSAFTGWAPVTIRLVQ
jgi:hypothetical protein